VKTEKIMPFDGNMADWSGGDSPKRKRRLPGIQTLALVLVMPAIPFFDIWARGWIWRLFAR
jgi:hypothetical protein